MSETLAIDWRRVQARIGVTADGIAGPITWAAVLRRMGATTHAAALGAACAGDLPRFGIAFSRLRCAHWLGQMAHESGGFRWLREIWGPTPAQLRYEGRRDLGNTQTGDGRRYMGRGIIQITGRANYARYGLLTGLPLLTQPELAEQPANAVRIACLYWRDVGLNEHADRDDLTAVTRRINGGINGLPDRQSRTDAAKALLA
jgi:putative chitinase